MSFVPVMEGVKVPVFHRINMARVAPSPATPATASSMFLTVDSGSDTWKNSTNPSCKHNSRMKVVAGGLHVTRSRSPFAQWGSYAIAAIFFVPLPFTENLPSRCS